MSTTTGHRIAIAEPSALLEIEASAPDVLKRHFDLIRQGVGRIPGVTPDQAAVGFETAPTLRALGLKPGIFTGIFLTEYHAGKEGEVPSSIKELLATAVSARTEANENVLCTPYHAGAARLEGADESAVAIAQDFEARKGELDDEARTVIELGLKAAYAPAEVTDTDVDRVRALGYSDAALVEIVITALVAYTLAAVNQVFDLTL